ncbi:lethal(3)malignant brain tumor-like protein 3 [Latimeria chalumnae]
MDEPTSSENVQDFDVFSVMDWKDGIGTLPGSDLKFRVNEFGALEVITEEAEVESVKKATATTTWTVPTAQEAFSETATVSVKTEEASNMDGVLCCENCCHYGTMEEFVPGGKFCSEKCAHQIKRKEPGEREEKESLKCSGEEGSKSGRKRKPKLPLSMKGENHHESGEEPEEEADDKHDYKVVKGPQRIRRKRRSDSALLKQTLTFGGKKKAWCWASYLEEEKAVAAPNKLFKECQSYPHNKNGFKVGMKFEGVDPEHPSMYCVLTVAEVCGYRMRLHFDKYSDGYDFWVNVDSPDIHPVGWCEKTGHKLHPPKGMKEDEFNWPSYLKMCKAQAANKSLFENQNTTITPSGFRVGMKLEAVDKKNPTLTCVATVTDMVDSRFLVHFDNWDHSYDYWCDATSPYIHPVGWCKEHGKPLTTPPDYPNARHFSWEKYLEETNSLPTPARAFKVKPPHGFQKNMKLEVVDKRNPVLIRVATIVDTEDHRIKIHFDGWNKDYDYWIDADSPDLHPAGWCAKTGYPLQPPISPLDLVEASEQGGCPTPGCKGIGHIKGARYSGHHSAVGCPYSEINMNKESVLPDRLSGEMPLASPTVLRNKKAEINGTAASPVIEKCASLGHNSCSKSVGHNRTAGNSITEKTSQEEAEEEPPCKKPLLCDDRGKKNTRGGRQAKNPKVKEEEELESEVSSVNETTEVEEFALQQALHQSVFMSSTPPLPSLPLCWEQQSKLLPNVAGITASRVSKWSVDEVSEFIQTLPGCEEQAKAFRDEQIDGEAFLLLTQVDIVKIMSIKLGPALKIYNSILMFQTAEENSHNEL